MVNWPLMTSDELLGIGHLTLKVGNKRMLFNPDRKSPVR